MTIEFDHVESSTPPQPTRRRRVVAGIGAAMLVAAAGGIGFGIGRSLDDGDQVLAPAADTAEAETEPAVPQPASEADELAADPAETDEPPPAAEASVPATEAPADELAVERTVPADVVSSGGQGWSVFGDTEMSLLFDRTLESGLVVRAHLGQLWDEPDHVDEYGQGGWQPPGWCYESGQVRVALGGPEVIDVGSVSWFREPFEGRSISWLTLGRPDGAPHRVVFVQAPAGTTLVTVAFGDGSVDSVEPQNGVAVLAVPGAPSRIEHDEGDYVWYEETADFAVTLDGDSGAVAVGSDGIGTWDNPTFVASCTPPPPALPEPGEQPADPVAAEAEVVALMTAIYGPDDGLTDALDLIDDPTGVAEAREEVAEGSFAESAASAEAYVEELVFTSPTEAWFRYRIETDVTTLRDRFGIAVQIDGVWKITRATICQDLATAGGSCVPFVDWIVPPAPPYQAPPGD